MRIEGILDRIHDYHPQADVEPLMRAYVFAAKAHKGQERISGEPYLSHPLEVAGILTDLRLDTGTVAAGLLHDVVEDTHATLTEIKELFGNEVATVVDGVTKLSRIPFSTREEAQAENIRKMILAMSKDIRVILVKLADRLHNMRTLDPLPEAKRRLIAQETLDIYAPLAHRLGISWIKAELEDLALRHLDPQAYHDLAALIARKRKEREGDINEAIRLLEGQAGRGRDQGADHRPPEAFLQHLQEDARSEEGVRRDLRPDGGSGHHELAQGLLRDAGRDPHALEADLPPFQGLHRRAEEQRLPVPSHHGHRSERGPGRDPDPHPGDAPGGGGGDRGALEIQGGQERHRSRRPELCLAAPAHGVAAGAQGLQGVPGHPARGPVPRRGLRLHPARGRPAVPARAPRPSTSRSPFTPTSACAAWGPRSTAGWCRCARSCRTATSSRSSPPPTTCPARTGSRSSRRRAPAARSGSGSRTRSGRGASVWVGICSRRRSAAWGRARTSSSGRRRWRWRWSDTASRRKRSCSPPWATARSLRARPSVGSCRRRSSRR